MDRPTLAHASSTNNATAVVLTAWYVFCALSDPLASRFFTQHYTHKMINRPGTGIGHLILGAALASSLATSLRNSM